MCGIAGIIEFSDHEIDRRKLVRMSSMAVIETGWTQAAKTVTVNYSAGWELAVDDISYVSESGGNTGDGASRRTSVPIDITHLEFRQNGKRNPPFAG
jgi:hypothetical protein